jgi:WD40 repeat protein
LTALAVSPDGSWLASASHDATVRLWKSADGTPGATLTGHTGSVRKLAISPDGSWLASAGDDGTLRLWNTVDGACLTALRVAAPVHSVHWLPSAELRLACASVRGVFVLRADPR